MRWSPQPETHVEDLRGSSGFRRAGLSRSSIPGCWQASHRTPL